MTETVHMTDTREVSQRRLYCTHTVCGKALGMVTRWVNETSPYRSAVTCLECLTKVKP